MAEQRVERRLAAILAADVAGYSRLVRQDEEGTLAAVKSDIDQIHRPLVAGHNGRIFKFMGDGLLAEFASVVDAVRCAAEVQRALAERNASRREDRRIEFRIGVNLGDVVIDGDDIHGDGVNLAARLEGLARPGGICISGSVHEQVEKRIDLPFEDLGEHEVKNIDRPVHAWHWLPSATSEPALSAEHLRLPDKPSIAVLPFDNFSADPEQEYFADGMTEDIITELSRFEGLFVIARNTSFTYRGQQIDAKSIAQELGVQFILEGSVRKAGNQVRITTQLINGYDGSHVWAERYDGALENVFELQEQVTSQVVGSILPQVTEAQLARIGRGEQIFDEAHELAWRAEAEFRSAMRLRDPELMERAIGMAVEAVALNDRCGVAYQTICMAYSLQSLYRWGADPTASGDLAEDWAHRFHSQLPNSYMAYNSLGLARFRNGQYEAANRDFQRAHELNPNDSVVLRIWSWCEASAGDFESAKEHALLAIRLSPKDSFIHPEYLALAMAAFIERDAAGFEQWGAKAIQMGPQGPIRRALMMAYAAEAGNQSLLEIHRAELMRAQPDFINSLFRGENQVFQNSEHMAMLLDGLRKAGFPE